MTQSMARFIKCSRQLASALHLMTPTSAPTPSCPTVGKDLTSSFATGTQVVRTFSLTSSLVYLARLTSLRRQQPPLEQQLRQAMLKNTKPGMPTASVRVMSFSHLPSRVAVACVRVASTSWIVQPTPSVALRVRNRLSRPIGVNALPSPI